MQKILPTKNIRNNITRMVFKKNAKKIGIEKKKNNVRVCLIL